MKCMYAQTRPRFILSSEGVLGGMEFEPMLTPREKSPLPKMSPEEDRTKRGLTPESSALEADTLPLDHMCLSVGWLVGWLTSQQRASISQGRICSDKCTCSYTEIEDADRTFYPTQSQYTDTGPTSPRADPITSVAWQGSHCSDKSLV